MNMNTYHYTGGTILFSLYLALHPVGTASAVPQNGVGLYNSVPVEMAAADGSEFSGGSGTESDPWLIEDVYQLAALNNYVNEAGEGKYFALQNDLEFFDSDFSSLGGEFYNGGEFWIPIGQNDSNIFCGSLDGKGFTISGLKINRSSSFYVGLFGHIKDGSVKNLNVEYADTLTATYGDSKIYVGGLAGYAANSAFSDITIKADISASQGNGAFYVGGLSGYVNGCTLSNCSVKGDITTRGNRSNSTYGSNGFTSGVVGYANNSLSMDNITYEGTLSASKGHDYNEVAGLVGCCNGPVRIERSTCSGSILSSGYYVYAAGLIANAISTAYIADCSSVVDITISNNATYSNNERDKCIGGLIGRAQSILTVIDSTSAGSISCLYGATYAGGLIGTCESRSALQSCSSSCSVDSNNDAAGLVSNIGGSNSFIRDCNASGDISGVRCVGGLIGEFSGAMNVVESCYATGAVTGKPASSNSAIGGLFGSAINSGEGKYVRNCYAAGKVTGNCTSTNKDYYVCAGGLIGDNYIHNILECYATGDVEAFSSTRCYVGGLCGSNQGSKGTYGRMQKSYATGNVTVTSTGSSSCDIRVGGLNGQNLYMNISESFATGNVNVLSENCPLYVGGLVGDSTGSIENCYVAGNVNATTQTSDSHAGGLIGRSASGDISHNYATGSATAITVSGSSFVGGIVAESLSDAITQCVAINPFIAVESETGFVYGRIAGQSAQTPSQSYALDTMTALGNNAQLSIRASLSSKNGANKTVDELKTQATYEALEWDFDKVWSIQNAYPVLKCHADAAPVLSNVIYSEADNSLLLEFDSPLNITAAGDIANYTVKNSKKDSIAIQSVAVNGKRVTLYLENKVLLNDGLTVTAAGLSSFFGTKTSTAVNSPVKNTRTPLYAYGYYSSYTSISTVKDWFQHGSEPDRTMILNEFFQKSEDEISDDNICYYIKGWLLPPETGNYRFAVSSDDYCYFYLSADETEANLSTNPLCYSKNYSTYQYYNSKDEQQSVLVYLEAGKSYYFEYTFYGVGTPNYFSLAWSLPSQGPVAKISNGCPGISSEYYTGNLYADCSVQAELISTRYLLSQNAVVLNFNTQMDEVLAENIGNYVVTDALGTELSIIGAKLSGLPFKNQVTLFLEEPLQADDTLSITASNLQNHWGYGMGSTEISLQIDKTPLQAYYYYGNNDLTTMYNYMENRVEPDQVLEISDSLRLPWDGNINGGKQYTAYTSGYLIPPETGEYTFYMSGYQGGFKLSSDETPENLSGYICQGDNNYYNNLDYPRYTYRTEQKSAVIELEAGKAYYFELWYRAYNDSSSSYQHIPAIAWVLPSANTTTYYDGWEAISSEYFTGSLPEEYRVVPELTYSNYTPSANTVTLKFNTQLDAAMAEDITNYVITDANGTELTITNTVFSLFGDQVILSIEEPFVFEDILSIRVKNAMNRWGFTSENDLTSSIQLNKTPLQVLYYYGLDSTGTMSNYIQNGKEPDQVLEVNDSLRLPWDGNINGGKQYTAYTSGYLIPPETGEYTFYMSGYQGGFKLSSDETPENLSGYICQGDNNYYNNLDYPRYTYRTEQKSAVIELEAGKAYYFELWYRAYNDSSSSYQHIPAIAWVLPSANTTTYYNGWEAISSEYFTGSLPEESVKIWKADFQASDRSLILQVKENFNTAFASDITNYAVTDANGNAVTVDSVELQYAKQEIKLYLDVENFAAGDKFTVKTAPNICFNNLAEEELICDIFVERLPLLAQYYTSTVPDNATTLKKWVENGNLPDRTASMETCLEIPTSSTAPVTQGVAYGAYVNGYLLPPVTGTYRLYLLGGYYNQLWLSTDETRENLRTSAFLVNNTSYAYDYRYSSGANKTVTLDGGKAYYFEMYYRGSTTEYNDVNVQRPALGWAMPGSSIVDGFTPISERYFTSSLDYQVNIPPTIDEQPKAVTATEWDDISISVQATGSAPMSYQWYKDGIAIEGATHSYYSVNKVKESDTGVYTVKVSNAAGAVISESADVKINLFDPDAVQIWYYTDPQRTSVVDVRQYANTEGVLPNMVTLLGNSLEMERSNRYDHYGVMIRGLITPEETGEYRFYISADDQAQLWLSSDATPMGLGETAIAQVTSARDIRNYTYDNSQRSEAINLTAGESYYFEVYMWNSSGDEHLSVAWATPSMGNVVPTTPIPARFLKNAWLPNSDIYVTENVRNIAAMEGDSVTFSVKVRGEGVTYQWYHNGTEIEGAVDPTLILENIVYSDEGTYGVIATNESGSCSSAGYLKVSAPSVSIMVPPSDCTIAAGETATFKVTARGNNTFTYQWFHDGVAINGATSSVLTIKKASIENAGEYTVTVRINNAEVTSTPAVLTVLGGGGKHPADSDSSYSVTVSEVTAYGSAWKSGETWEIGPNPIPISYVTRAGVLWRTGEDYELIESAAPPMCWISTSVTAASERLQSIPSVRSVDGNKITIDVTPAADVNVYAVEEKVPAGFTVSAISDSGCFDKKNNSVKWGPWFDNQPRTLKYTLVPDMNFKGVVTLCGVDSFDGVNNDITGQSLLFINAVLPDLTVTVKDNQFVLSWDTKEVWAQSVNLVVQSAPTAMGPWTTLENNINGMAVDMTEEARFFRLTIAE